MKKVGIGIMLMGLLLAACVFYGLFYKLAPTIYQSIGSTPDPFVNLLAFIFVYGGIAYLGGIALPVGIALIGIFVGLSIMDD